MIRYLFSAADQEYENHEVKIEFIKNGEKYQMKSDEWLRDKHLAPFGQLPYLEITDDNEKTVRIAQTDAIGNFSMN